MRELARRTGAQPGTLNRELRKLADVGILVRTQVGNQVHYQANKACPIFDELAGLLRKTTGIASALAEALLPLSEKITYALLFGSVARGTGTSYSDVDVLIIGQIRLFDAVEALHSLQDTLGREINPVVYRVEEFRTKALNSDTWAREVISQPKVFLIGDEDDFANLVSQ